MSTNEQSPQASNPLLPRMPSKEPAKETPKEPQLEPQSQDNVELGPKGFPRPAIEVTYSPDADRHGPIGWTILDGKDDNRHYIYERNTPTDRIRAKMRGFQPCLDKNITTGFDDKSSSDEKIFGDLVLMETSREHWERMQKKAHEDANAWKKPQRSQVEQMQLDSVAEVLREKYDAVDDPSGSGKKVWGFPSNPLGK